MGWFYHQATNSFWEAQETQWLQHSSIPQCTCQLHIHSHGTIATPPPLAKLECTTAAQSGNKITLTGHSPCEQNQVGVDPCHQLRTTQIYQQWDLAIELLGAQWEMHAELSQGFSYAVSNGLFKDTVGAAAWIIEGSALHIHLIRQWHTPGPLEAHSSFRSELASLVGVLYTLTFGLP